MLSKMTPPPFEPYSPSNVSTANTSQEAIFAGTGQITLNKLALRGHTDQHLGKYEKLIDTLLNPLLEMLGLPTFEGSKLNAIVKDIKKLVKDNSADITITNNTIFISKGNDKLNNELLALFKDLFAATEHGYGCVAGNKDTYNLYIGQSKVSVLTGDVPKEASHNEIFTNTSNEINKLSYDRSIKDDHSVKSQLLKRLQACFAYNFKEIGIIIPMFGAGTPEEDNGTMGIPFIIAKGDKGSSFTFRDANGFAKQVDIEPPPPMDGAHFLQRDIYQVLLNHMNEHAKSNEHLPSASTSTSIKQLADLRACSITLGDLFDAVHGELKYKRMLDNFADNKHPYDDNESHKEQLQRHTTNVKDVAEALIKRGASDTENRGILKALLTSESTNNAPNIRSALKTLIALYDESAYLTNAVNRTESAIKKAKSTTQQFSEMAQLSQLRTRKLMVQKDLEAYLPNLAAVTA